MPAAAVAVRGDRDGNGPQGGQSGGCLALGVPPPGAPALFTDSLACLKNCMRPTAGSVRPSVEQFHKYLPWFLNDEPNIKCPKG